MRSGKPKGKRLMVRDFVTAKVLALALKSVMRQGDLPPGDREFMSDHAGTVTELWLEVLPLRDALHAAELIASARGQAKVD